MIVNYMKKPMQNYERTHIRLMFALLALSLAVHITASAQMRMSMPVLKTSGATQHQPAMPFPRDNNNAVIEGACRVRLTVDKNGNPKDIRVLVCTDKRLDSYAAAAVSRNEYTPATKNGKPVSMGIVAACRVQSDAEPGQCVSALHSDNSPIVQTVSSGITMPVAVYTPQANMPESAKNGESKDFKVQVGATVTKYGDVQDLQIIKSSNNAEADSNAIAAVRMWLFKPAMKDGKPIAYRITAEVDFTISYGY